MQVEESKTKKRTDLGTNKNVASDDEYHRQNSQFEHFVVDIDCVWFISHVADGVAVVYQHRSSLRPLVIIKDEDLYTIHSQISECENIMNIFNISTAGDKIPSYLTLIDHMYENDLPHIDPNMSDDVCLRFMCHLGFDVKTPVAITERKILKASRKKDNK